jgi:hypothetical protein
VDDEELLGMAKALGGVSDLSDDERKFIDKILDLLKQERKLSKKDVERLKVLHEEHLGEEAGEDPNDDVDEDDFV